MLTKILNDIVKEYSWGSITLGDLIVLNEYCANKSAVVELGTNKGTTTKFLSKISGQVTTIDIFEDIDLVEDLDQREFYRVCQQQNGKTFDSVSGYLADCHNVNIVRGKTAPFAKTVPANSVDVVFVDADHSYTGIKADFEAWFHTVKLGGYFLFHDTKNAGPGGAADFYRDVLREDLRLNEHRVCPNIDHDSQETSIAVFAKRLERA